MSLGYLPEKYKDTFFERISDISSILVRQQEDCSFTAESIPAYFSTNLVTLYNADCVNVMRSIPDGSVDLVFADPPFNLAKTYDDGIDDN